MTLPAVAAPLLGLVLAACGGTRPATLGPTTAGRLAPCPESPNCVSSYDTDEEHGIAPLAFSGDAARAWARLQAAVADESRVEVVTQTERYLHAEFTSFLFRFVDDVEFLLDEQAGVIHCRSASRVGRSDLGVNRRRIERLRAALRQPAEPPP